MQIHKQSTPFDPSEYISDKYYNQAIMKDIILVKKTNGFMLISTLVIGMVTVQNISLCKDI